MNWIERWLIGARIVLPFCLGATMMNNLTRHHWSYVALDALIMIVFTWSHVKLQLAAARLVYSSIASAHAASYSAALLNGALRGLLNMEDQNHG